MKKENQKLELTQLSSFGSNLRGYYYGGPIFDKRTSDWRTTFYTRADGEVLGAAENRIPLPTNMDAIVRSVCVMTGPNKSQSGFWVDPCLSSSTLHFHNWIEDFILFNECEKHRQNDASFWIGSEMLTNNTRRFSTVESNW